jgi:predicted acylesterase/phospholipase RssA
MIKPGGDQQKHEIELRIVVTPLNGIEQLNGEKYATTYEKVIEFTGKDFDTQESLDRVFNVVAAACAFPGLFGSVNIAGLGACVDGGVVNNAPIKYAVENSNVGRVIVPVPFPLVMPKTNWGGGFNLLNHLVAILINERLFRDLASARAINGQAAKLKALVQSGSINEDQRNRISSELEIHHTEIVEIRPQKHMNCSPFSPFFFKRERMILVEEGQKAALVAIKNW